MKHGGFRMVTRISDGYGYFKGLVLQVDTKKAALLSRFFIV